jgi:sec-independent protein translocase protein TatB
MTLFGIGPMELMLILVVALVVFGPKRLPEIARTIGKAVNDFRRASENVTSTVMRELDVAEDAQKAAEDLRRASESMTSVTSALTRGLDVAQLARAETEELPSATRAISPVHSIPLDAVGKVQVLEEPPAAPAAETLPVVSQPARQEAVSDDQTPNSSPEAKHGRQ